RRLLRQWFAGMQCLQGERSAGVCSADGKGELMNYRRSMPRGFVAAGFLLLLTQTALPLSAACGSEPADLRDIRVGMTLRDLPDAGYTNFSCPADPAQKLSGWESWKQCPAGADGMHAVRFDYDLATSREGTL